MYATVAFLGVCLKRLVIEQNADIGMHRQNERDSSLQRFTLLSSSPCKDIAENQPLTKLTRGSLGSPDLLSARQRVLAFASLHGSVDEDANLRSIVSEKADEQRHEILIFETENTVFLLDTRFSKPITRFLYQKNDFRNQK